MPRSDEENSCAQSGRRLMPYLPESELEQAVLEQLRGLGYAVSSDREIGPDGAAPERESYGDTVLRKRLAAAIARLNPHMPAEAQDDALRKVLATETPSLVEENRRLHALLVEGAEVEYYADDATIRGDRALLIDFIQPDNNDWLACAQFTVVERGVQRRADIVLFVNGLALAVIELKAPGTEAATPAAAFQQLQTYKAQVPSLFRNNALLVASDGLTARVGSLTADLERFMPWRTRDGREIAQKGVAELDVLIDGVFDRAHVLALLRDFMVFGESGGHLVKIVAGYHQFHAVRRAVDSTLRALALNTTHEDPAAYGLPGTISQPRGDKRIGVIWHTQGSGKSLLMAFYAGQLVRHPALRNPTIVVVTDRNDLDDQLFNTFAMCRDLIRQTPLQADSREDLQTALNRVAGGVIFTTIQKFSPPQGVADYPMLSDRGNIVVIADEAHRSQYGLAAKVNAKKGEMSYGFAKYLRDALPNASFIGFTGTPIEATDINTERVFGHYIDIYDISRAVEDGATVPIYYESRLARIELPQAQKPVIDAEIEALTEDEALLEQEKIKRRWAKVEALVGAQKRLEMVASDLVRHFEDRTAALDGKGMVVCMSRRICVALYEEIVALRPEWHSDDDNAGTVKVVMTGSAADPERWQPHIGGKARRDLLARRAKAADDPLKLVIVRDMWLTGFDAPSMHTMYVDKPMQGHGLMQAIARVNRVFRDKPAGLIVDYIGIAQHLKQALGQYSGTDRKQTGVDAADAIEQMLSRYEVVRAMFHGFDYASGLHGTPRERLRTLAAAMEWVLAMQQRDAARETDDDKKRKAHRRYADAVLALSTAFALASASDEARGIREEVAFFQAVRAALAKTGAGTGLSTAERDFAIRQLLDRAVVSTEIVDILGAAGMECPDISILSDAFLAEVQQLPQKNLALEALRKLLNDQIRARSRTHLFESKKFSERLEDAIARYHTNAISTVEVLQEMLALAKEVAAAHRRGEEEGLSQEELAFYTALSENESAVQIMGNDALKLIAHELLVKLKGSITVDWSKRESARARMRVLVKGILREHGYPPDMQSIAVQNVLQQAEALSAQWAV
jgi:type I restriction enzyme, R subunit